MYKGDIDNDMPFMLPYIRTTYLQIMPQEISIQTLKGIKITYEKLFSK